MSNPKAKKRGGKNNVSGSAAPPGFAFEPDGSLSVKMSSVPRSPLEIMSTGFLHKRNNNEVLFLFGHASPFDDPKDNPFTIAVEISMSLNSVYKALLESVWEKPSSNNDNPMITVVERGLSKNEIKEASEYICSNGPPPIETRSSTYRAYQADFVSAYVWGAHGGLEFFTLPSSIITTWKRTGQIREGDRTSSKLTVVMSRFLIYAFFLQVRDICKDYNPETDPLLA